MLIDAHSILINDTTCPVKSRRKIPDLQSNANFLKLELDYIH